MDGKRQLNIRDSARLLSWRMWPCSGMSPSSLFSDGGWVSIPAVLTVSVNDDASHSENLANGVLRHTLVVASILQSDGVHRQLHAIFSQLHTGNDVVYMLEFHGDLREA